MCVKHHTAGEKNVWENIELKLDSCITKISINAGTFLFAICYFSLLLKLPKFKIACQMVFWRETYNFEL